MSYLKISALTLIIASFSIVASDADAKAGAEFPLKIHALTDDSVCGELSDGTTRCLDYKLEPIRTFDSVTNVASPADVFVNTFAVCVRDTEGIKCSLENPTFPLRQLLTDSIPNSVKLGSMSACGIASNGVLTCSVPNWYDLPRKAFRYRPVHSIKTLSVGTQQICWADGDVVVCRRPFLPEQSEFAFRANEIAVSSLVCARNEIEAKCFGSSGELPLSQEFVTAKRWVTDSTFLCAITADERFVCLDWKTGAPDLTNQAQIPAEFQTTSSGLNFGTINSGYEFCLANTGSDAPKCWTLYGLPAPKFKFSGPIRSLDSATYGVYCALMQSGELECRNGQGQRMHRLLKKSGSLHTIGPACYSNSSGVSCTPAGPLEELTDVIALNGDNLFRHVCAIGTKAGGSSAVHCSLDGQIETVPYFLPQASSLAVGSDKTCAIQAGSLYCWGEDYAGEPRPGNFLNVTKVALGENHACAIDEFGLACWGELAKYQLQVPSALTSPGEVTEVAVGRNRTCTLLKNQTVQCWGQLGADNEDAPKLIGVTELIGSGQHTFCAKNTSGYHCWGGFTTYPK